MVRDRLAASPFAAEPRAPRRPHRRRQPAHRPAGACRRILGRPVRIGRPLGIAGLPEAAKGPAFAVAAGLLVYPQVAHLEHFEPRRTRHLMTGTAATSPGSDDGCGRASDDATRDMRTEFHRSAGGGPARHRRRRATPPKQEAAMSINLKIPDIRELKPRITVFGVGGAGGNAVNNMITAGLQGVDFVVANTDAQALTMSKAERIIQMGVQVTEGLGAGSQPEVGRAAAEEVIDEIRDHLHRRAHGVRHRRHGRRHRHRRGAGRSPGSRASWASSPSASSPSRSTSRASAACASPRRASSSCRSASTR